ncbi:alpha/beta hydrolase [Cupriavidus oxalaticus]|uniref:alpha/beta hydrolase n=1 Tax=Cupriavidus oxalaticus TaxID=96344 RepID=UPI003182907E
MRSNSNASIKNSEIKLKVGRSSFGDHCFDCAKAISVSAQGGVIEECGHWVFEEKPAFIIEQLGAFWTSHS